jgi:hypothetical protein
MENLQKLCWQPVALVGIFVQAPLAPFIQKYPDSRAAYAV